MNRESKKEGTAQKFLTRASEFIRSDKFFYIILVLFVIQSLWIAISAVYPQPFDENTHFAIIQLYAHHWSPFLTSQPPGTGALGAVTRDPSYLYHYLLSFPYRVFAHYVSSLPAQIIFLRVFGVAFFTGGLFLFRKVLQKTKAGPGVINAAFLFFILIPVVPFLAGQLNYDNLLMLLTPLTLLLAIKFSETFRTNHLISLPLVAGALATALLGSLVKMEFLPILLAIFAYTVFILAKQVFIGKDKFKLSSGSGLITSIIAIGILLLSFGLFFQRYGVNYLKYGAPLVQCSQVLPVSECGRNGSWAREQAAIHTKTSISKNPAKFTASWIVRMFISSFYTRSGGNPGAFYINVNPLPIISAAAIAVFVLGAALFIRYSKILLGEDRALAFLLFVSLIYILALWLHLYSGYVKTGQKYGINGRYLFPAILPVMLAIGMSYRKLFSQRKNVMPVMVAVVFLLFLQGGGILTFIVGSNQYWYWDNSFVRRLNEDAQSIAKPLIVKRINAEMQLKEKLLNSWRAH